jgi:hypothetical protein
MHRSWHRQHRRCQLHLPQANGVNRARPTVCTELGACRQRDRTDAHRNRSGELLFGCQCARRGSFGVTATRVLWGAQHQQNGNVLIVPHLEGRRYHRHRNRSSKLRNPAPQHMHYNQHGRITLGNATNVSKSIYWSQTHVVLSFHVGFPRRELCACAWSAAPSEAVQCSNKSIDTGRRFSRDGFLQQAREGLCGCSRTR